MKELDIINNYWKYNLDLSSIWIEELTWDFVLKVFNGPKWENMFSTIKLIWLTSVNIWKEPYIDNNTLTPYWPIDFKVSIVDWMDLLYLQKKYNPYVDYLSAWKHYLEDSKIKWLSDEDIEKAWFEKFWPKKKIYLSITGGIYGHFLCDKIYFKYLDFKDWIMKEINL